jgi:hypothetical protein
VVAKISVSFSEELTAVIDELARRRGDDRSPLIETLLRENPLVQEGITLWRKEAWTRPPPPVSDGGTGDKHSTGQRPLHDAFLNLVAKQPGLTAADLARRAGCSNGTAMRYIIDLEVQGFVERHPQGNGYVIFPTKKLLEAPRGTHPP